MSYQLNAGAVRRFAKAMKFGAWLQAIPNKLTPAPFRLMQIGSAFWQSRALYVATRLDIATVLGNEELDADTIAARVSTKADPMRRLLRLLASMGVLQETAPHLYRNNKISTFLRTDNPKNVRAIILMHNSNAMSRPWYEHLEQGIREGVPPFRITHGEDLFDYLDHHSDLDSLFSEAMSSVEALIGDSFATDFDWGQFERIIDVGGSRGTKSLAILKRHQKLSALVVDRPHVISDAELYWSTQSTSGMERLCFQAGDALTTIPSARSEKDIYLLSAVLHAFNDETCITVLRNVADACGQTGARVALLEIVLPDVGADIASASFDMQMFMGSQGRERTLREWEILFDHAGMTLDEVVGLQSFGKILVLLPKKRAASNDGPT